MDWARAIKRNSEALSAILASLFAMLGLTGGAQAGRIARPLHRAVLRILRPAESAMRRLIVIAARGLVVKPSPVRPATNAPIKRGGGKRAPAFPLFDPRKRFAPFDRKPGPRVVPRIWLGGRDPHLSPLWSPPSAPVPPPDDGRIDASRLAARLEALKLALDDLPRQARRLVRARARRDKVPSLRLKSPMRPGRPPGYRKKPVHDVDHILAECHGLARDAMALDTS